MDVPNNFKNLQSLQYLVLNLNKCEYNKFNKQICFDESIVGIIYCVNV